MERIRQSEGHSHPGDGVGSDESGHEKNPIEQGLHPGDGIGRDKSDTERIRPREVHLPTGDGVERDKLEHGKNTTERSTHILETASGETVRARKEYDRARGTYHLETTSGGTGQDTERIRLSERHSLTGGQIGRDKSRHGKNLTEQGALTLWRRHREEQVRSQDTKRNQPSEGHSLSRDGIGRDKSGHGKNPTRRGALTLWRQVRTRKESDRARGTHILESASGGTSQDTERIRLSEGHLPTGDGVERDESGHGKNPTKRGVLTSWRRHREGQVRTRKESNRATGTHQLETV